MIRVQRHAQMEEDCGNKNDEASEDDAMDDEEDGPWFSMGLTKEEKQETRKP